MLRLVCLAAVAACAFGAAFNDCRVTEWSEWGECVAEKNCKNDKKDSFPVTHTNSKIREARRALSMSRKELARSQSIACRAAGTCPELELKKSNGKMAAADCVGGEANTPAGTFPCANIRMNAFLDFDDLGVPGSPAGNDIWGWTDSSDGEEYTIMGTSQGTTFVRTTVPSAPEVLCFVNTHTSASSWRDIKVIGNTAFIVSEASDHGVQIFYLERLRDMVGQSAGNVPQVAADQHYGGIGQSHNIIANPDTGFLYVVGARNGLYNHCDGGLHMVDVGTSGRETPIHAGCFDADLYTHDAECVIYNGPDTTYVGQEICFAYNEDTLTIVNVEDKSNPQQISRTGYAGYAYTHQGWNLESQAALLLDDEQDETDASPNNRQTRTYFWDISNLASPVLRSTFVSQVESIDHNQYIVGDLTFQSNYESGLRILEIDEPNYSLTGKAFFQVYPGTSSARYEGTWSNYPYFAKNTDGYPVYVPVSSINYGLFILEPEYPNFPATSQALQMRGRTTISGKGTCPALAQYRPCVAPEPVC